jgi:hypothetical protein
VAETASHRYRDRFSELWLFLPPFRFSNPEKERGNKSERLNGDVLMKETRSQQSKKKQRPTSGESSTITRAVTPIRLVEVNPGKLAALDALAAVYLDLCQRYVTLFCTDEPPNKLRAPLYKTELSERWHRVAIMQAAGIAQSWRTNRARAYQAHREALAIYEKRQADPDQRQLEASEHGKRGVRSAPLWREWHVPALREPAIQANVNVVRLEASTESTYDYWLIISTLAFRKQLRVPVKLAPYHRQQLEGKTLNTSVQLNRRAGVWWLTVSYDQTLTVQTPPDAPVVGIDVGIVSFLTTSDGKQYGSFQSLSARHRRDRAKRQRKAKLQACLQKKGAKRLPSTSSRTGQRLIRHTKHCINRAVKECFMDLDHQGAQFAYEDLSVASMRFKARAQNAYLRASNLGYIPCRIQWNATKQSVLATPVQSAYSSQECSRCHYTHRKNRPTQKTFFCQACGW